MLKKTLITIGILVSMSICIISEDSELLTYTHSNPEFSFNYPADYLNGDLKGSNEVVRLTAPNMFKVPALVANVIDDKTELNGDELTDGTIERLKSHTPGVYGFKAVENKYIALSDGSRAHFLFLSWKWVDGTPMETVAVTSYKDGKRITLSSTAFKSQNLFDILKYLCMTLKMS